MQAVLYGYWATEWYYGYDLSTGGLGWRPYLYWVPLYDHPTIFK